MQTQKEILTVSQLNQASQTLLENYFSKIWVEGEISNLARPTSGHLYFSLKDAKAQVRCALFRFKKNALTFEPQNGLLVHVQAKVSIYPDRGDYQLIVESMEPAGDGRLRQLYEQLIRKLEAEGLFQEHWKKPLPLFPKHIGVITSTTGAAIRDILSVLKRRFPYIPITIYPTKVQGSEATAEIIRALALANQHQQVEVLILARGGGSLEDLWPFNEESVARAIFASHIPVISGIGHEIDFTIADWVADKRAPTPSAAAELATPHQNIIFQQFFSIENQLYKKITQHIQHQTLKIDWLQKRLRHPGQTIQNQIQILKTLYTRLLLANAHLFKNKKLKFTSATRALEAVSPLSTLNRGYAIVSHANKGNILRSINEIETGDSLKVRLKDGMIDCVVQTL